MLKNASNSARKKRILVVDDEEMFRKGVVKILQLEGYSTFEAGDGDEGLRAVLDKNPDLIISDVHMPNMNGFMMLEELQKNTRSAKIPVIMMTGVAQKAGAWSSDMMLEYLEKPFSLDTLVQAVKKILK